MASALEIARTQAAALLAPLAGMTPDQRVATLGARLDFSAAACLMIRTKGGGPLVPFVLNPIQTDYLRSLRRSYAKDRRLDTFRGIRDIIVKPRQLGFSTEIAAMFFLDGLRNPGRVTVILSHDKGISEILLETYSLFWEHLPGSLKAGLTLSSDTKYEFEICFPDPINNPPSKFIIQTEAGHPWRGGVIHNLHGSEAAFYKDYPGFMASYVQGVAADGNVVLETTANGQNLFYQDALKAKAEIGKYRLIFYEWFRHPEYRIDWDPSMPPPTHEEAVVMGKLGLDLSQLAWRRAKIEELGDLFLQEYPEDFLGAFLSTGRPFFDQKKVGEGAGAAEALARQNPETSPLAGVRIFEDPQPGNTYVLAMDVAEGKDRGQTNIADPERGGADFCSGHVVNATTLRVAAVVHGRFTPVEFARICEKVGRRYRACIAPERNNHGHTVVHYLESVEYPWLYRHLEYDVAGQRFLAPGFPTNTTTRPQFLDALAEAVRAGRLVCQDAGTWREMHTFARNPTGKPEALPGCHDDRVVSLGIAIYLCTLGRLAWGLAAADGTDSAGVPVEFPGPPGVPAPSPYALSQPAPTPLVVEGGHDLGNALDEARSQLRSNICGTCVHGPKSGEGPCAINRFRVRADDPACAAHYPRLTVHDTDAFGWPSGDD